MKSTTSRVHTHFTYTGRSQVMPIGAGIFPILLELLYDTFVQLYFIDLLYYLLLFFHPFFFCVQLQHVLVPSFPPCRVSLGEYSRFIHRGCADCNFYFAIISNGLFFFPVGVPCDDTGRRKIMRAFENCGEKTFQPLPLGFPLVVIFCYAVWISTLPSTSSHDTSSNFLR